MTTFTPGKRENVGLWVNMIGGTGSGKTFSGMRLAAGIAGDKPFAVIDTENRRALHYADQFKFDHAELRPPFRPDAYAEAVTAADAAGYPVILIDSGSHVWAGDGGLLDWQEEELNRMAGDDWKKRERVKMSAWIKPKMAHKHMVQKLLQVKAHIILCLRAEQKIEMVKDAQGKLVIQAKQSLVGLDGWIPICDKNLPFEATCSFLLLASNPGVPHPIKLQEQHRGIFPLDQPITEESGRRLAQWASGETKAAAQDEKGQPSGATSGVTPGSPASAAPDRPTERMSLPSDAVSYITAEEALAIEARCTDHNINIASLKKAAGVERISLIKSADLPRAHTWLDTVIAKRARE